LLGKEEDTVLPREEDVAGEMTGQHKPDEDEDEDKIKKRTISLNELRWTTEEGVLGEGQGVPQGGKMPGHQTAEVEAATGEVDQEFKALSFSDFVLIPKIKNLRYYVF
jgi:hypothetical protein